MTKPEPISIGTFGEEQARAMARALNITEGIGATVKQLFLDERETQPTSWWHLYVPAKHSVLAGAWIKGYRYAMEAK
jgi:hypothetical protein